MMDRLDIGLGKLNDIIRIQGTVVIDQYMQGLMNGLILARSTITDDEPDYVDSCGKIRTGKGLSNNKAMALNGSQSDLTPISVWVAISKKTLRPVDVKSYMEDLPFEGNWLIECDIELP